MVDQADDRRQRRLLLRTRPAPNSRIDAVTSLVGRLEGPADDVTDVIVRYIADRDVLLPESLGAFLPALPRGPSVSVEDLAVTVLDDLNDQLVPRWIRVHLRCRRPAASALTRHDVVIEERQPGWDNASLLSRLPPVDD